MSTYLTLSAIRFFILHLHAIKEKVGGKIETYRAIKKLFTKLLDII